MKSRQWFWQWTLGRYIKAHSHNVAQLYRSDTLLWRQRLYAYHQSSLSQMMVWGCDI